MWSPADRHALPTAEDLEKAKDAIDALNTMLDNAIASPVMTESLVKVLTRELEERRAWIAPIRRLKFDELSAIFEWCADFEWTSPLRIELVSRTWREVVLASPRAWSFVDMRSHASARAVKQFFDRSGERELHLCFPHNRPFDLLSPVAHRIQCLSVDHIGHIPRDIVFPRLIRLSIGKYTQIPLSSINVRRYPLLRHLVTKTELIHSENSSLESIFLLLEKWAFRTAISPAWMIQLRTSCASLVSLKVNYYTYKFPQDQVRVTFPVLKYLEIVLCDDQEGWTHYFATPVLETYLEYSEGPGSQDFPVPVHAGLSTVTRMRLDKRPPLPSCPSLKELQIYFEYVDLILIILDQLYTERESCPDLQSIELLLIALDEKPIWTDIQAKLAKVNSRRVQAITLVALDKWGPFPVVSCTRVAKACRARDMYLWTENILIYGYSTK